MHLGIRHVDPQLHINSTDSSLTLADSMMNSVVEFYSLAATDYKVLTMDSGFGKIASFLRGKPDTTVSLSLGVVILLNIAEFDTSSSL